jgi:hypothetical protein
VHYNIFYPLISTLKYVLENLLLIDKILLLILLKYLSIIENSSKIAYFYGTAERACVYIFKYFCYKDHSL